MLPTDRHAAPPSSGQESPTFGQGEIAAVLHHAQQRTRNESYARVLTKADSHEVAASRPPAPWLLSVFEAMTALRTAPTAQRIRGVISHAAGRLRRWRPSPAGARRRRGDDRQRHGHGSEDRRLLQDARHSHSALACRGDSLADKGQLREARYMGGMRRALRLGDDPADLTLYLWSSSGLAGQTLERASAPRPSRRLIGSDRSGRVRPGFFRQG